MRRNPQRNKQNHTNTSNLQSNQAGITIRIHNELRNITNLSNLTESEAADRLSILDICTLCTKSTNTYELSDENRAEKLVQILYSIDDYLKYLNIQKLNHVLNKLKILNDVPVLMVLIAKIEKIIELKKSEEKPEQNGLIGQFSGGVSWNHDYESSEAFKTQNSYQSYRKSRDLITQCFSINKNGQTTNFQLNIRSAIHIAITGGNLVKLSRFIVTCFYNSELDEQFVNSLVSESVSTGFSRFLAVWVYHYLKEVPDKSQNSKNESFPPLASQISRLEISPLSKTSPTKSSEPINIQYLLKLLRITDLLSKLLFNSSKNHVSSAIHSKYSDDQDITELSVVFQNSNVNPLDENSIIQALNTTDFRYFLPWFCLLISNLSGFVQKSSFKLRKIIRSVENRLTSEIQLDDCTDLAFLKILQQELPVSNKNEENYKNNESEEELALTNLNIPESSYYYNLSEIENHAILQKLSNYWNCYNLTVLDLFTKKYSNILASSASHTSPVYRSPTKQYKHKLFIKSPTITSPTVTSPTMTLSGLTSPGLTSPDATSSTSDLPKHNLKTLGSPKISPKRSAARKVNLKSPSNTTSNTLRSESASKFSNPTISPTSANKLSNDQIIENAFMRNISPSIDKAISVASDRVYSNTIRDYRTTFEYLKTDTNNDDDAASESETAKTDLILAESIEFCSTNYKSACGTALLGLLPPDWTADRIYIARIICEKRAFTRITQWLLQRKDRLFSFANGKSVQSDVGLDEHTIKILKSSEIRNFKDELVLAMKDKENCIFTMDELQEMSRLND